MDYENTDKQAKVTDVPAIAITLQYPLDEGAGRGMVFQTFIAADCAQSELNAACDKVRKAADRQRAAVMLPTLRGLLSDKQDALHNAVEANFEAQTTKDMLHNRWSQEHRESGRRGESKLSSSQAGEMTKIEQQIGSSQSAIITLQKEIVIYERRVADTEKLIAEGE